MTGVATDQDRPQWPVRALSAAGFVTAFGAHGIAANLGGYTHHEHASLWVLGLLLAVYDGAEIVLKPVFGALSDRIGPRPVLLGGLLAFALASAGFVLAGNPALVGVARLGQGAAAAAFSPAASTLVARLTPGRRHGRTFGGYGAYKSIGYVAGPLLGGALVTVGGFTALFAVLAVLAVAVAGWAALTVPAAPPRPRTRQTVLDLARRLTHRDFLVPTVSLAAATAALTAAVGFLPVLGATAGLTALETGAVVSVLAVATAVAQPWAGRALDAARLSDRLGMAAGLVVAAGGLALAALGPGVPGLVLGALLTGSGIGVATPLGFAALADRAPADRLGETMGAAEVGRELGDAGGPLLVAAAATIATLTGGLLTLAALLALAGITIGRARAPTGADGPVRVASGADG